MRQIRDLSRVVWVDQLHCVPMERDTIHHSHQPCMFFLFLPGCPAPLRHGSRNTHLGQYLFFQLRTGCTLSLQVAKLCSVLSLLRREGGGVQVKVSDFPCKNISWYLDYEEPISFYRIKISSTAAEIWRDKVGTYARDFGVLYGKCTQKIDFSKISVALFLAPGGQKVHIFGF